VSLVYGTSGKDLLITGDAADEIHALDGDDDVSAGGGSDQVYGDGGSDYIDGNGNPASYSGMTPPNVPETP